MHSLFHHFIFIAANAIRLVLPWSGLLSSLGQKQAQQPHLQYIRFPDVHKRKSSLVSQWSLCDGEMILNLLFYMTTGNFTIHFFKLFSSLMKQIIRNFMLDILRPLTALLRCIYPIIASPSPIWAKARCASTITPSFTRLASSCIRRGPITWVGLC